MKSLKTPTARAGLGLIAGFWIGLAVMSQATPDRLVRIDERILGTHEGGYVTLLSESDNLGSYDSSRTKQYLVRYQRKHEDPKVETGIGAELSRELVLDVTRSVDPDPPHTVTNQTHPLETTVRLADILSEFPEVPRTWEKGKSDPLKTHSTGGISVNNAGLVWGGWIKKRFIKDQNGELEWQLEEVSEDDHGIFLRVSAGDLGSQWVSLSPETSRQLHDQLSMAPFYIVAGRFLDRNEALAMARKWKTAKQPAFSVEIWEATSSRGVPEYFVVDANSNEHLLGDHFDRLEQGSGQSLSVANSSRFLKRIPVVNENAVSDDPD